MSELIKPSEFASLLGVSKRTVARYAQVDPRFPRRIIINSKVTRYRADDVHSYMNSLAEL
jgi:predicted DNA-binding transcriptional regulator AlpA